MVFINNMVAMLRQMYEHKLRSNNTDKYEDTCRVMHNYGKQVNKTPFNLCAPNFRIQM